MVGTGAPKCPDCGSDDIEVNFVRHLSGRCRYTLNRDGAWVPDFLCPTDMDDPLDEMFTVVNGQCHSCGSIIELDLVTERPIPKLRPVTT